MKLLKLNAITFFLLLSLGINAQNIDSLFVNMPDIINPVMNKIIRKQMLTDFKLTRKDSTKNLFMNNSYLLHYDSLENHIVLKNTAISTFEMKKFKLNNGNEIIGIISTLGDSLKNSTITFYNTNWSVNQLRFEIPEASKWLNKNFLSKSTIDEAWAGNQLKTSFIALKFTDKGPKIEANNSTYFYLSDETKKTLKPLLSNQTIIYEYTDNKWVETGK